MDALRVRFCAPPGERFPDFGTLGTQGGARALGIECMSDEERDDGQRRKAGGPFQQDAEAVAALNGGCRGTRTTRAWPRWPARTAARPVSW